MSNKRAELRRQQKEKSVDAKIRKELSGVSTKLNVLSKLTPERVSRETNVNIDKLNEWRQQEHDELEKQICREYQFKLERAEDLIQAGCVFAMINTFWSLYKIKFNSDKVINRYNEEVNKAFSNGIIDAARRAEKLSGLQFEFENMDLNHEFHLGDWKINKKISEMKPNEAYDEGFDNASILGNIINTAIFADWLLDNGFTPKQIQQCIIGSNKKAADFQVGEGKVEKFILKLRERGVDLGEHVMDKVVQFRL